MSISPKEFTDANSAIEDIESMEYAVNGLYDILQSPDYYARTYYLIPELMSDNLYLSRVSGIYTGIERNIVKSDNSNVEGTWNEIYRAVNNANYIIQKDSTLEVSDNDVVKKRAMIGQAYAIRALAHFDLCRLFAQPYNFTDDASHLGIPLVLESSFEVDEITYPKRSTVKEVYNVVIQDFKQAIERLPESLPGSSSSFKGKITLNAAKALLSRVYLYMEDWKKSEEIATEVIESKQYSLLATESLANDYSKRHNTESIFEIVNTSNDNHSSYSLTYYYNQNGGYGDALPTWDLYNIYSSTDVRRDFMEIGDRTGRVQGGVEQDVPLVTKFKKLEGNFAQDITIIRLAEVYLNRAEARAHLGDNAGAIADLTTIAKRSDPTVIIDSDLSGQELIDRILKERRKELAFEGQRLFDLTRNKMSFVKYRTAGGDSTKFSYPSEKTILPIPERELIENENLKQNPSY